MYPVFANIFVKLEIIQDVEQLKEYISIFKNFNILSVVIISIIAIYESDISMSYYIEKIIDNFDINVRTGNNQIQAINRNRNEAAQMAKDAQNEFREVLKNDENVKKNNKCEECKKEEIISERESLRYFATYQATNRYSRELLNVIKINGIMTKEDFKYNMQKYYRRTTNMGKKKKQEKVESLLYNLKYLNIIEYTEDDKYIILTQNGKEFINSNYNEEVG